MLEDIIRFVFYSSVEKHSSFPASFSDLNVSTSQSLSRTEGKAMQRAAKAAREKVPEKNVCDFNIHHESPPVTIRCNQPPISISGTLRHGLLRKQATVNQRHVEHSRPLLYNPQGIWSLKKREPFALSDADTDVKSI